MAFGADIAELIVALRLDDSGFSGKLNKAAGQLKGMDRSLGQLGRGAGQVSQGVGKIVDRAIIGAAAGLTGVIATAASFEQAWAGVTKTVEGANEDLLNDFKQLSREIPLSFEELAAIGAEGGALGIATEDLLDFTDVVARLAVSTDLTADQASTALGQLGNILSLSSDEMRDFGDSLVALGNDGASTESQILDMAARFGAAGKSAGLSNEEILALSSTVASMGIEAEAGGGALSRIFNNLTLDMGTASDEGKLLADTMGMSLGELKTAWEQDAGGVFQDLLGYINELDQFEAAEFLSDLGITNTRDINAIRNLASGVDEYGRQLGVAEGQTNELNKESDAFFNTTQGKWEILKNNVRLAADSIGSRLLPIVNELGDEFVTWLSDPKVQQGIEDFAVGLADGIRDVITEIKQADFGPLLDTLRTAADIAKAGFDAFNALPSGVKALALAAFGINKVTGGALTDIAKGFGNIFGAGLKILFERGSPTNPMFVVPVGGGLTGGVPGAPVPGGKTGGGLGPLRFLLPIFAAELASQVEPLIPEMARATKEALGIEEPIIEIPWDLDELQWPLGPKGAPDWAQFDPTGGKAPNATGKAAVIPATAEEIDASIARIDEELNDHRPLLEGIHFNTNTRPVLEEHRKELVKAKGYMARAAGAARDAIPWAQRNRDEIIDLNQSEGRRFAHLSQLTSKAKDAIHTLNASEGTRAQQLQNKVTESKNAIHTMNASEGTRAANFQALQRTANAYGARTASASEITSRKKFSSITKVDNHITVPVTVAVNASVIQQQIYRLRTQTNSGGFI